MGTSKAPFKVGDVVEMIPGKARDELVVGKHYEVITVSRYDGEGEWFVRLNCDYKHPVFASRFKLVDEFEGNV